MAKTTKMRDLDMARAARETMRGVPCKTHALREPEAMRTPSWEGGRVPAAPQTSAGLRVMSDTTPYDRSEVVHRACMCVCACMRRVLGCVSFREERKGEVT